MVVAVLSAKSSSLRSAVVDAARRLSSDMSVFISLLAEFDLSGEWAFDGARSCAHWVAERADTELCTVREWLRIAHALTAVDEIALRFGDGRLSYSKVRTLTRVADADNQQELCAIAERVQAAQLAVALAGWLNRHESPEARAIRHRASTKLKWRVEADGMVAGSFRYPPESSAPLTTAVDTLVMRTQRGKHAPAGERSSRCVGRWPSLAQQRADALLALITGGGANVTTEVGRSRPR